MKEKVCCNCRWCNFYSFPDIPCAELTCKRHPISRDHLTGAIRYKDCKDVCLGCADWERGGIVGFVKRLFKRRDKR